jgi:heme A synthase
MAAPPDPSPPAISDLQSLFGRAVSAVIALAGIALFIMLLIGGVKYITSGGDPKAVQGAKNTITYAIGGLILVVIKNITGAPVTQFNVVVP